MVLRVFRPVRERNVFRRLRWFAIPIMLNLLSIYVRDVLVVHPLVELEAAPFVVRAVPASSSSCPVPQPMIRVLEFPQWIRLLLCPP